MKNLLVTFTYYVCLLALITYSPMFVTSAKSNANQTSETEKLICEISLPSKVNVVGGWINGSLIIKNVSEESIRISALYSGSRHVWKGNYKENFSPDWWKTNMPEPEKFAEKIVTLSSNETFTIPFKIHYEYNAEFFRGQPLTISSGYRISQKFAEQYDTWTGSIEAKPVTVDAIE
ncbi:MAG TPA: hypothetical protein PKD24_04305 [Pyrinomonadaceae bacterium]|nr:hypothetical protein [Pyrinomonadaceae bacterium]